MMTECFFLFFWPPNEFSIAAERHCSRLLALAEDGQAFFLQDSPSSGTRKTKAARHRCTCGRREREKE